LEVQIKDLRKVQLNNPLFIISFPSVGMAGLIAADHIVQELGMDEVAFVDSEGVPPYTTVEVGRLKRPIRICVNEKKNLFIMIGSIFVPPSLINPLSDVLIEWLKKQGVREVVALAGASSIKLGEAASKVVCAATDDACVDMKQKGLEIMDSGLITGLAGALLVKCGENGIRGITLLTEAADNKPDVEAALKLIRTLNDLYNLKIDTSQVSEEVEQLKQQFNNMVKQYSLEKKRAGVKEEGKKSFYI